MFRFTRGSGLSRSVSEVFTRGVSTSTATKNKHGPVSHEKRMQELKDEGYNFKTQPFLSHHVHTYCCDESPEDFDKRFIDYFNREDLDGWHVRKGLNELNKYDVVPEPEVVIAALRAIRRINEYALTTRFLECIKMKCGSPKMQQMIYPYILQEVRHVLDELGISTPEEMGYDKPEFFHPSIDWWEKRYYYEYGFDKMPDKFIISH